MTQSLSRESGQESSGQSTEKSAEAGQFEYLDSDADLQGLCQALTGSPALAFDSEFIRTNTYFPKPGLFQVGDGRQIYLLDPLDIDDWQGFRDLLQHPDTTTVMHSSSEDLALLRSVLNTLPARLFDTQRAAAFAGHGYSLSYQALVQNELGIDVPKGETRSDWLRRPLSATQLQYAALDVEHLLELQQRLTRRLTERGMLDWFQQDCRDLLEQVPDETDARLWEEAYRNIGSAWRLDEPALIRLQILAYWREQEARDKNRPRNWIAKDQELVDLADRLPDTDTVDEAAIRRAEVFSDRFADRKARRLANFLNQDHQFHQPAHPERVSQPLSAGTRKQLKALQQLTRELAERLGISPELLSRKRLWVEMLEACRESQDLVWPPGLDNWRRPILEPGVKAIIKIDPDDS